MADKSLNVGERAFTTFYDGTATPLLVVDRYEAEHGEVGHEFQSGVGYRCAMLVEPFKILRLDSRWLGRSPEAAEAAS